MTCLFLDVKVVQQREDAEVHSTTLQYLTMPLAAAILVLPAVLAACQVQLHEPVAPWLSGLPAPPSDANAV